jgi:hypothetical protein
VEQGVERLDVGCDVVRVMSTLRTVSPDPPPRCATGRRSPRGRGSDQDLVARLQRRDGQRRRIVSVVVLAPNGLRQVGRIEEVASAVRVVSWRRSLRVTNDPS